MDYPDCFGDMQGRLALDYDDQADSFDPEYADQRLRELRIECAECRVFDRCWPISLTAACGELSQSMLGPDDFTQEDY